jgi:hypothetical protein
VCQAGISTTALPGSPDYLKQRHNISDGLLKNIAGVGLLLQKAVG